MSKKRKMVKDRTLTFRLPDDIYQKIDYLAEQQWCSVSAVVRNALRKELEENKDLFNEEYYDSIKEKYGATD